VIDLESLILQILPDAIRTPVDGTVIGDTGFRAPQDRPGSRLDDVEPFRASVVARVVDDDGGEGLPGSKPFHAIVAHPRAKEE
jgi:hypothetical protein